MFEQTSFCICWRKVCRVERIFVRDSSVQRTMSSFLSLKNRRKLGENSSAEISFISVCKTLLCEIVISTDYCYKLLCIFIVVSRNIYVCLRDVYMCKFFLFAGDKRKQYKIHSNGKRIETQSNEETSHIRRRYDIHNRYETLQQPINFEKLPYFPKSVHLWLHLIWYPIFVMFDVVCDDL